MSAATSAVLSTLGRVLAGPVHQIPTPFGVTLSEAHGRHWIGQHVSAPGIDRCSPRIEAEVLAVGTRDDLPGTWYLLRDLRHAAPGALMREQDLAPIERRGRAHPQQPQLERAFLAANRARFA